jgi:hypothetical protein
MKAAIRSLHLFFTGTLLTRGVQQRWRQTAQSQHVTLKTGRHRFLPTVGVFPRKEMRNSMHYECNNSGRLGNISRQKG